MWRFALALSIALSLAAAGAGPAHAQSDTATIVARVMPSPDGSGSAFADLDSALKWAVKQAGRKRAAIEIQISPGTYLEQSAVLNTNHLDIERFRIHAPKGGAIFDGVKNTDVFLRVVGTEGKSTNITVENLVLRRYRVGLDFYGNREEAGKGNGKNTIRRVTFEDIGGRDQSASTAALLLVNSSDNVIEGNTFSRTGNTKGSCGAFHAIYVTHMSLRNQIRNNSFEESCGDPIRIRDGSNGTVIEGNRFAKVGIKAVVSEWHCDRRDSANCTKKNAECPVRDTKVGANENATRLPLHKNVGRQDNPDCPSP